MLPLITRVSHSTPNIFRAGRGICLTLTDFTSFLLRSRVVEKWGGARNGDDRSTTHDVIIGWPLINAALLSLIRYNHRHFLSFGTGASGTRPCGFCTVYRVFERSLHARLTGLRLLLCVCGIAYLFLCILKWTVVYFEWCLIDFSWSIRNDVHIDIDKRRIACLLRYDCNLS